jgi:flagellar motor switch/type III secretory pathway protein FliN
MSSTLNLKKSEKVSAELNNLIFSGRSSFNFLIGDDAYTFTFLPASFSSKWEASIYGKWGEADYAVFLNAGEGVEMIAQGLNLGRDGFLQLPEKVRNCAVESFLNMVASSLQDSSNLPVSIDQFVLEDKGALDTGDIFYFSITSMEDDNDCKISGAITLNDPEGNTTNAFASSLKKIPVKGGGQIKNINVGLVVEVGSALLSIPDYKKIEAGDVVLLDKCASNSSGEVLVRIGNTKLLSGIINEDNKIEIQGSIMSSDENIEDVAEGAPVDTSSEVQEGAGAEGQQEVAEELQQPAEPLITEPKNVEVTLQLELDRVSIPLEDVEKTSAGYTLETEKDLSCPIDIRANGKLVGKGELVDINGKVGVKVTEFSA